MAITFLQAKKRQRYLIFILVFMIFAILIIVLQGFLRKSQPSAVAPTSPEPKKIIINWPVLQAPQLEELQVFETIAPLEGEAGRKNPFIPY